MHRILHWTLVSFFEKIRINPGNFSDRAKNSSARSHLAFDMQEGKERFRERVAPLAKKLKEKKLALRIGINQGSLSFVACFRLKIMSLKQVDSKNFELIAGYSSESLFLLQS